MEVGVRCRWRSAAVRWLEGYGPMTASDDVDPTLRYFGSNNVVTGISVDEDKTELTIAEEG